MKCPDCKTKNINDANYCINCCHKFTESELKLSRSKSLVGLFDKIDKINKVKDYATLKVITGSLAFKILTIVVILLVGAYSIFNKGNNLRIEESKQYQIEYNQKLDEYYLIVKDKETNLNLYIPNKTEKIILKVYDSNNNVISKKEIKRNTNIKLETKNNEEYYIIESSNDKYDKLKVYLFSKE